MKKRDLYKNLRNNYPLSGRSGLTKREGNGGKKGAGRAKRPKKKER